MVDIEKVMEDISRDSDKLAKAGYSFVISIRKDCEESLVAGGNMLDRLRMITAYEFKLRETFVNMGLPLKKWYEIKKHVACEMTTYNTLDKLKKTKENGENG